MRAHHLDANGVITNTIMVPSLDFMEGLVDASIGGQIGDSIINGQLVPAPPPVPEVPAEVSRRRGLQALYIMYGLTEDAIVAKITQAITDPAAQYLALTEFKTSQTFERHRPLVLSMAQIMALDLDALFIKAASLP